MKKLPVILLLASMLALLLVLFAPLRQAHADTYHQLKACLRHDIDTTSWGSWARFVSVLDCYAAWGDQKISINISIGVGSSGYDTRFTEGAYVMVEGLSSVTVDLDISSGDPLERIDLFLLNDTYNAAEPDFGLLVGSDTDGSDGWSVTFDPNLGGTDLWVGYVVAEAHFAGHDLENDGDVAAIYTTRNADYPLPPPGGTTELLVEGSDAPGSAADGSGPSAPLYAAIAGAAAAAAFAIAAGGWYARRRWLR
jgi:hypothetical protein